MNKPSEEFINKNDLENTKVEDIPKRSRNSKKKSHKGFWWIFLSILMMLFIILFGAFLGYQNGIRKRLAQEESSKLVRASEQYDLGLVDLEDGRYQLAKERFEYVIDLEPSFPGAAEGLRNALLLLYETNHPTESITATSSLPTATPTEDYRGAEELYNSILSFLKEENWDQAIQTLEVIRQNYIEYRTVDVDGLYYIALRNRGVSKILYEGSLEPGIYDLSLAEKFAPLDKDADGYRSWARLYLTGASYWDINWEQVIYYFSQIQPAFPYLRDGSGMTATDRYRIGLMRYGDQLAQSGLYCEALQYYNLALALGGDVTAQSTAAYILQECEESQYRPVNTRQPTSINPQDPTPTPTPEGGLPTEVTPTEPTAEP